MDATVRELLDLVVRWAHIIAGIMWIGNSMLFNWLDRNLTPPDAPDEHSFGKIWLLHSGAFYEVEKKLLPPGMSYPSKVHWFMFQNLTTWLSGVGLLVIVYYMGGAAYMVDPGVAAISHAAAVAIGVGSLVGAWLLYEALWRSPIRHNPPVAFALSLALLLGLTVGLTQVLSGRAAYIHVGALLGTIMTGNVWFVIIPSQRELVAATRAGRAQDPAFSIRAKERSIHNNYMTFPVLFIMISSHFPSTYGHQLNWLLLAVLMVGSAAVRHFMNIRYHTQGYGWLRGAAATGILALAVVAVLSARTSAGAGANLPPVAFAEVQAIINRHCIACHSSAPTDAVFTIAPAGVIFETPEQIQRFAARIKERAVVTRTMPFGNQTGMTEAERTLLGAWIDQGADVSR